MAENRRFPRLAPIHGSPVFVRRRWVAHRHARPARPDPPAAPGGRARPPRRPRRAGARRGPLGGAAGLAAAQVAIGPDPGSATLGAALPALVAILLAMAAVLWALVRLARGGEDQGPVWLLGVAALALTAA